MYYVYALVDPINKLPFYIGKGSGNRMFKHLKSDKINKKKIKYIENIRILGYEPIVEKIIDNINDEKYAYELENLFIKKSIEWNLPLVNRIGVDLIPPSRKGIKWKKESIIKRTNTVIKTGCQKNKIITEEQKQKISKANKGKEGPNKVYINTEKLYYEYIILNKPKKEILKNFNIGMGSLNRILYENKIYKTKKLPLLLKTN